MPFSLKKGGLCRPWVGFWGGVGFAMGWDGRGMVGMGWVLSMGLLGRCLF